MRTNPPNKYRFCAPGYAFNSTGDDGMNGAFTIPIKNKGHRVLANCIVSDGYDPNPGEWNNWEHVSVHIEEFGKKRMPTWDEMCQIKDIFWHEHELVVQYHPPKSEYVNCHPCVLHLWRCKNGNFPTPPKMCV